VGRNCNQLINCSKGGFFFFGLFPVNGDNERDFTNFMVVPDINDECHCYEAFYNATSNEALTLKICPVCAGEKMKKEEEEILLLSDPLLTGLLICSSERNE
jgi:hypothetical protein